ncbi:MAG: hypothetical protein ACQCN6_12100 [Candidatus Bathyarchaeia archaeon]
MIHASITTRRPPMNGNHVPHVEEKHTCRTETAKEKQSDHTLKPSCGAPQNTTPTQRTN